MQHMTSEVIFNNEALDDRKLGKGIVKTVY
jgi:hypothetical protein